MDQFEVARESPEWLLRLAVLDHNLKQRVIVPLSTGHIKRDGRELLVSRIIWRGHIVGQEHAVRPQVTELNDISMFHGLAFVGRDGNGRQDLPLVVGVIVRVSRDLLALARNPPIIIAQRVPLPVTVEEDLGVLVPDGEGVVVLDANGLRGHQVVTQGFLEFGRHEIIAGAGPCKDGEVDLEPEEIEEQGQNDQAHTASHKMLAPLEHREGTPRTSDIQQVPQVDRDRGTDGDEREDTNVLGRDDTAQRDTGQQEPLPPLAAKRVMAQLIETNVAEDTQGHGEHQGGIHEDQSIFGNMGVVKQNQSGRQHTGRQRITRLPHDLEHHGHRESTESGGHGTESNIRDLVLNVRIANVLEQEVAIVSDQPAHQSKEEFTERRVNIEEIGALEIVRGKLQTNTTVVSFFLSSQAHQPLELRNTPFQNAPRRK